MARTPDPAEKKSLKFTEIASWYGDIVKKRCSTVVQLENLRIKLRNVGKSVQIPTLETHISHFKGIFEDDFPFPQMGYVSSLEGTSFHGFRQFRGTGRNRNFAQRKRKRQGQRENEREREKDSSPSWRK